jgi:hypothetical protein
LPLVCVSPLACLSLVLLGVLYILVAILVNNRAQPIGTPFSYSLLHARHARTCPRAYMQTTRAFINSS